MPDINWYPGHMAKTRRVLSAQLKIADAVIEICDARAPAATRNPDLKQLTQGKARILVLNKADLANDAQTKKWLAYFQKTGQTALAFVSNGGRTKEILSRIEAAVAPSVERMRARGVNKTVRLMIVGIPNVGKSTFINRLRGTAVAKTADRPGVTRAAQWIRITPTLELMDTPGMLWPRLENQRSARTLAFLGSIRDQIMDSEELSGALLERLMQIAPEETAERFKLSDVGADADGTALLQAACYGRGWLMAGGVCDTQRASHLVLDEFRAGRVGRITLESIV